MVRVLLEVAGRRDICTVLVEPDRDRACLVWAAETKSPVPMPPARLDAIEHAVIWE